MCNLLRTLAGLLTILLLTSPPVFGYEVALNDGRVIQFQKYRATETALVYIDDLGKEISIPLSSVDLDRTRGLNSKENPPLDLPGLITTSASGNADSQPSLGDIARKLRKGEPKATRRAYTTDDLAAGSSEPFDLPPVQSADSDAWRQRLDNARKMMVPFEDLDREKFSRWALGDLNVDFPDRKEWEVKLFEQKQTFVNLVQDAERMFGEYQQMRDTMKEVKELTKGEEAKYEEARKRLGQSIDRFQAQWTKVDSIINDGKRRALAWRGR
jgi:hypothetical protein